MRIRPRLTIPRRVFLAFALMLTVSGLVSVGSFVQHERTAATLSLVHEGYLPLALIVSEARATQSVFDNLLERVLTERNSVATRLWLNGARKTRPATLERALDVIAHIEHLAPADADRASLASARRELKRVLTMLGQGENRYRDLYTALDSGDKDSAERILADLRARERAIDGRLRAVWASVLARIEQTSVRAAVEQQRALAVLGALVVLSLLVGVGVTVWSQRVLSPLPRLQERVEAVARGDLAAQRLGAGGDDEIGRLGREFERMVAALAARDESLQRLQAMQLQSERLAAVGRMAAHVTHEVRNPLSSIGLNVELLEEELAAAGPETKDLLRAIHREIEHLTAITEEYLRVARLPNPQLEPEDLGDIARSTAEFLKPELAAAGVTLTLALAPVPLAAVDEAQVRQVLLNLLKNAREAMPDGGKVRLEVAAADGGVVVRVADDGAGMNTETRARIFDLFYTTKKGGTGLGLPLSQQIVVAHGGTIRCESEAGRGTTFELWFPLAETSAKRDAPAALAADAPAANDSAPALLSKVTE